MQNRNRIKRLALAGILCALIIVMTVVPYTGYITTGPIEITTLHIVVIIGAAMLGWKYGALFGAVWGITCIIRATTNPLWIMFTNPLISLVPRVIVGIVAGLVFAALRKTRIGVIASCIIAAIAATLTNTVLVLSSMYVFGGMISDYAQVYELFKSIYLTIIGMNGGIELAAAALLTPVIYKHLQNQIETLNRA